MEVILRRRGGSAVGLANNSALRQVLLRLCRELSADPQGTSIPTAMLQQRQILGNGQQ